MQRESTEEKGENMKKLCLLTLAVMLLATPGARAVEHRLGVGGNYWTTLDDIELKNGSVDDNGYSVFGTYQYWAGLFALEVNLEFLPDRFGDDALAPQAFVLVGSGIYAGVGTGIVYTDSEFAESPFLALKAGLNLEILPGIYADIHANYHFNDRKDLDNEETDIDTDTVFLGAAIRFTL
jgi:hypothetical protein